MAACEAHPEYTHADITLTEQRFFPSNHLLISCGVVAVDIPRRLVALLRHAQHKHIVLLPKGRKNIGEDLLACAVREGREETGVRIHPLPLRVATRSTPPEPHPAASASDNPQVTSDRLSCEPSSVCVYPCIYTGAFKIVFWFAAQADSSETLEAGTREPWEEEEVLEWVDVCEAPGLMAFDADAKVIRKVLDDMRNSGYDI